jgi:capsular polysaccharide biosynthesis protein
MKEFLLKIKEKWQTIMILVFMVVAITFSVSVFIPAKYSSEVKMMIIQDHQSEKVDAFSAAKSAEYLSDIISKVIFTESFIQNVFDAPFELKDDLPVSSEERMKAWERKVDVNKQNNTGILTITVFDSSQKKSELLADSIAWALNVRGSYYHGGGETVHIKNIDGPIVSDRPAFPNVLLNTLFALFVGLVGSLTVVYFFDDFKLVLFSKKNKDDQNGDVERISKITANLNKIRESLKSKKEAGLTLEDNYQIEKKEVSNILSREDKTKEEIFLVEDIDKAFEKESPMNSASVEDMVNKKAVASKLSFTKAMASEENKVPENLPVFEESEVTEKSEEKNQFSPSESENEVDLKANGNGKNGKDYISLEELDKEAEKMGLAPNQTVQGAGDKATKYEASSDEVKERLNKLLRGEL